MTPINEPEDNVSGRTTEGLEPVIVGKLQELAAREIEAGWLKVPVWKKLALFALLGATKFMPEASKTTVRRKIFPELQNLRHDFMFLRNTGTLRRRIEAGNDYLQLIIDDWATYTDGLSANVPKMNSYKSAITGSLYMIDKLSEPIGGKWPVDIIIPVGKKTDLVRKCITSIREHTDRDSYRIVICALEGSDLTGVGLEPPDSILYHNVVPFNYAAVNNLALDRSQNDVVLLNDDTEVTAGWLEALAGSSRGYCLAGARTGHQCCGNPDAWDEGEERLTFYPINMFCLYIPARAREILGNLEPKYCYYGGEDVDYSIRALESGLPLVISPAFVHHHTSASFAGSTLKMLEYGQKQLKGWQDVTPPFNLSNKAPLISVIIATYNRAGLLLQSVLSMLRGEYTNIEVIVVDDGSTDMTPSVVKYLSENDHRINYIRNSTNMGPDRSRTKGLGVAKGEFIAFHDDDDVAHTNRIIAPLRYLVENPATDACYCDFDMIQNGIRINRTNSEPFSREAYLDDRIYIGIAIMLFRRRALDICPLMPEYDSAIDFDWVFRAVRQGIKIDYCPSNVLDYYFESGIERMSGGSPRALEQHREIRDRENFLDSLNRNS